MRQLGGICTGVIYTCCKDKAMKPYRWWGEPRCIGLELEKGKSDPTESGTDLGKGLFVLAISTKCCHFEIRLECVKV